ncbi:Bug family tripartite tricarboxylate transporter substrate binding protein [Pollutimonas harenae]|uniref:Tripartite tricarboxylate transporter substrate binding protein n=1 Tax=Pollutimonas harenae TaxID=657015 RepID=A0A853GTD7_9BURK|nr:tripartite tricarboxylate transporter substrate binding protein [Pollutimonas harenae]NYT86418.1 tripartite tricarboxylate transporter substrate binding protein [Pollutimonas harenae]TEA69830.1 tripartite tricarboxylate transporter substrate binding protein [Pollutimonas harenae]
MIKIHAPLVAALAAVIAIASAPAQAASFPERPVRVVVPWPAGGLVDLLARSVAEKAQASLGVSMIVENKPGAGGAIGASEVARAAPDGYTIMLTTSAMNMNAAIRKGLTYDVEKSFVPIAVAAYTSLILVTSPDGPDSVQALINKAQEQPGQLSYASAGIGTPGHFAGEMLKSAQNINVVHVPYKGGPPAMVDQISGRVDYHFANAVVALPQLNGGKIKALAVASANRVPQLPDVPTMAEAGVKGFNLDQWLGYLAPAGTPSDVTATLHKAIVAAAQDKDLQAALVNNGMSAADPMSSEAFKSYLSEDFAKWKSVAKASDIHLE